jgi:hypothetical protein
MADAMDSKSIVRKGVRVRIPPRAPGDLSLWELSLLSLRADTLRNRSLNRK